MKKLTSNEMAKIHKDEIDELLKMKNVGYDRRENVFDNFSVEYINDLLCCYTRYRWRRDVERHLIKDLIFCRRYKLNERFNWTPKRIKRLKLISKKIREAWEDTFVKVKDFLKAMNINEKEDKNFWRDFSVELFIEPEICDKEDEPAYEGIYSVLCDYMMHYNDVYDGFNNFVIELNRDTEKSYRQDDNVDYDDHLSKEDFDWPACDFSDVFRGENLCYTLHSIACRAFWVWEDVLKINHITSGFRIKYRKYKLGSF